MKTKIVALGLIAVVAGVFAYTRPHTAIPSDLRDAVADKGFDTSIPSFEKDAGNIPEPKAEAVEPNTARAKKGKSSASDFGRWNPGGGPLFERMQEKAQATDEDPYTVLKRMFETGKQPGEKDLLVGRMLAGRAFFPDHEGAKVPVFIAEEVDPEDGPLFSPRLKVGTVYNGDEYCSLDPSEKAELISPVKFKDGSAVTVWKDEDDVIATRYRINSGYLVSKTEVRTGSRNKVSYAYFFGEAECVTETTTVTSTGGGSGGWVHRPFKPGLSHCRPGDCPLLW